MGIFAIVLLACAVVLVGAAEWPRLREKLGVERRATRDRDKRKARLTVVRGDRDDFAASVERDLANLPVIEERDSRR